LYYIGIVDIITMYSSLIRPSVTVVSSASRSNTTMSSRLATQLPTGYAAYAYIKQYHSLLQYCNTVLQHVTVAGLFIFTYVVYYTRAPCWSHWTE